MMDSGDSQNAHLSREELYELRVKALTSLAKELRISDVAMAKRLSGREYSNSRPRVLVQRVEAGQKPRVPNCRRREPRGAIRLA